MRTLNLCMAAVFLVGAIVQLNDPDPVAWMMIYLAAMLACFVSNRRPRDIRLPSIVALVALVWAGAIALEASGRTPLLELFAEWEMMDDTVEQTRETYGLLIIAAWMAVLVGRGLRHARAAVHETSPTRSTTASLGGS